MTATITPIHSEDFEVVNAFGTVFLTTSEIDRAMAFVKANRDTFPGLVVQKVIRTVTRKTVYRARGRRAA